MKKYFLCLFILIHISCKEDDIEQANIPSLYIDPVKTVRVDTEFEYEIFPVYNNPLRFNEVNPSAPFWLNRYNSRNSPKLKVNIIKIPGWMQIEIDSTDGIHKILKGIPGTDDIGSHEIILEVTNDIMSKGYTFQINVVENIIASEFVNVPAGPYVHGYHNIGGDPENIESSIDYDFQMMKYEVTNQEYLFYLEEALKWGEIKIDYLVGPGYNDRTPVVMRNSVYSNNILLFCNQDNKLKLDGEKFFIEPGFEKHPVTCVTINGALGFAKHFGLELPYEKEWQKAARGMIGTDYSFGENYGVDISKRANYFNSGDPWDNGTTPVGYFNGANGTTDSKSPYGVYDMTGNVSEWAKNNQHDPVNNWDIVTKGGDWGSLKDDIVNGNTTMSSEELFTWHMYFFRFPGSNDYSTKIGFRCIKK